MMSGVSLFSDDVKRLLEDKSSVSLFAGVTFLFAGFFRALVGSATFQTSTEVVFFAIACAALLFGLVVVGLRAGGAILKSALPLTISFGALVDVVVGAVVGRASTPVITLMFVSLGLIGTIFFLTRPRGEEVLFSPGSRQACNYDLLVFPLIYLGLLVVTIGSVFGCLFLLHVGGLNRGISQLGFFVGSAVSGAFLIMLMMVGVGRYLEILAKSSLLFMVAGLSMIIVFLPSFVSLLVLAVGFCVFLYVSFCMIVGYFRCFELPSIFPIGYLILMFVSLLVGLMLGDLLLRSGSLEDLDGFTLGSMLLLNVMSIIGLGTNHCWNPLELARKGSAHELKPDEGEVFEVLSQEDALDEIGKEFGLTPREREVFALLSRGRNASYIENELVISNHTARAHILKIYKKLGVHSQQEVIDIFENRIAGAK